LIDISDLKEMAAAGVPLREIFRRAASETLCEVLAIEASEFLGSCQNTILEDGSPRFILNGRTFRKFAAPCGVLDVRQPRLRDKAGGEKKMLRDSLYLPAFIRRFKEIEDIIPYLYLKGLSTEGISGAFVQLFGEDARGFSSAAVCRLIGGWEADCAEWNKRTIEDRCPYLWIDGIFLNVRGIEESPFS
jgi:transposase-like protein